MAATSDCHAARLVFQDSSARIADSVLGACLVQLARAASMSVIRACRRTITGRRGCPRVAAGCAPGQPDTGAGRPRQDLVAGGCGQLSQTRQRAAGLGTPGSMAGRQTL